MLSWLLPPRVLTLDDFARGDDPPVGSFAVEEHGLVLPGSPGVHDASGRPVVESFLQRGPRRHVEFPNGEPRPVAPPASADEVPNAIFLGGADFGHFGHMLTETAAWLADVLDPESGLVGAAGPDAVVLVAGATAESIDALRRILGLPDGRVRATASLGRPVRCGRVFLPRPSLVLRRFVSERQSAAVRRLVDRRYGLSPETSASLTRAAIDPRRGEKVYLSRARLPSDVRALVDEERLEDELRSLGWTVVHPELLPMAEQLATLARARTLAGNLGSAFHLLLYFGRDLAPTTVLGLGLRRAMQASSVLNFVFQFRRQPIDFRHLGCLRPVAGSLRGKAVRHRRFRDLTFLESPQAIARRLEGLAASHG